MVSGVYNNQMVSPETLSADSSIIRAYWPYKQKVDAEMDHIIGYAQTDLVKGKPESKLTNFLADLLLEEATRTLNHSGNPVAPQVAFLNYGGIRTGIAQGDVTVRKIFELMPFENELVVLQLSGSDMQLFLDLIASRGGDSVSGVRFKIKNENASEVAVGDKPLDPNGRYWLATSDYVADGGDNYHMLHNSLDRINTSDKIRDVIIRYLERTHAEGMIINPETDGRIVNE
jgi:2',3'-cyclic-nucleotide 2'-phosphodiesterase (5'-nucleotidase family)